MSVVRLDDEHGDAPGAPRASAPGASARALRAALGGGLVEQQHTQGPSITAEGLDAARTEAESVEDFAEAQELIAAEEENAAGARGDFPDLTPSTRQLAKGSREERAKAAADIEKAKQVYNGYEPMSAEDVASIIYYVTTLPENVCINDLVVTSLSQAHSLYIKKT